MVRVVVPAAVAVVVKPVKIFVVLRLLLASHPAQEEAVGAMVTVVLAVPPFATARAPAEELTWPVALFNNTPAVVRVLKIGAVLNVLAPATVCVVVRSTKFCEVEPVPPLATGRAVPEYVRAKVPLVVMLEGETLSKLGTVIPTEVTDPLPLLLKVFQSVEVSAPVVLVEAVPKERVFVLTLSPLAVPNVVDR